VADAAKHRVHTIAVTNAPFVFPHTEAVARGNPFVRAALGFHPELVATHGQQLGRFVELLSSTRFVGEVGLDHTTNDAEVRKRQRSVFESILQHCADARERKVITVHSRRAAADVIAALGTKLPGTVILHWFTGTLRELERALPVGAMFSVNSAMLSAQSGQRLVRAMPRDMVLTESDGPFVGPKSAPESPTSMQGTIASLAALWGVEREEAQGTVLANFKRAIR
jgi:TatD DNase family protein